MGKLIVFSAILLLSFHRELYSQEKKWDTIICDTISSREQLCLGDGVFQYRVATARGGILVERMVYGSCWTESFEFISGSVIYCEEIYASPKPGMIVRKPPRKIYVQ